MHDGSNHAVDGPSQAQSQPSADDVRAQLERLVASPDLDVPARARKFLRYIVEETLAGRGDRIKAYSVGTEVFERDPNFDAQSDPVVRIEAGRLRRALEHYYLVPGLSDPVIIDVPKGAYVPHFTLRAVQGVAAVDPPAACHPAARGSRSTRHPGRRRSLWLGLGAAAPGRRCHRSRLVGHLASDPTAASPGIRGHDTERADPGRHAVRQPGRRPGNEDLRPGPHRGGLEPARPLQGAVRPRTGDVAGASHREPTRPGSAANSASGTCWREASGPQRTSCA